jgi:predicted XRE-type DNA-binding protein
MDGIMDFNFLESANKKFKRKARIKIKKGLHHNRISGCQICKDLNIQQSNLSAYLRGKPTLSGDNIQKIIKYLDSI